MSNPKRAHQVSSVVTDRVDVWQTRSLQTLTNGWVCDIPVLYCGQDTEYEHQAKWKSKKSRTENAGECPVILPENKEEACEGREHNDRSGENSESHRQADCLKSRNQSEAHPEHTQYDGCNSQGF